MAVAIGQFLPGSFFKGSLGPCCCRLNIHPLSRVVRAEPTILPPRLLFTNTPGQELDQSSHLSYRYFLSLFVTNATINQIHSNGKTFLRMVHSVR
jgi:hypothetical protein